MNNIIRPRDVFKKVGLSRSTIWRMERQGHFPRRVSLGAHAVGYIESEIDEWVATRPTMIDRKERESLDSEVETSARRVRGR